MFNYFGSKHRLAKTYQPPKYPHIIEPFGGAAGYSVYWMRQDPSVTATLYEKDELVAGLWRRLLDMSVDDICAIPRPVKGERTTDLLVALTASAASSLGSFRTTGDAQVTEWMARDFPQVLARVAAARAFIGDRITVIHGDYIEAPDVEATWHIDPPYQHQGRYFHNDIDFGSLATWVYSRRGQVMVCEASPADWLPFRPHTSAASQMNSSYIELIWESNPEPTLLDLIS